MSYSAPVISIGKAKVGNTDRSLTAERARRYAVKRGDDDAADMLDHIIACKNSRVSEMARVNLIADRFDDLYYPSNFTRGGADHFMDDPNLKKVGAQHISLNVYTPYVDVPAALISTTPIENIVASDPSEEGSDDVAAAVERVYFAWKEDTGYEMLFHKGAVARGLYGRAATKVWWDADSNMPKVELVDQPRNLWLGWGDTDYRRLDWAIYVHKMTPQAILREFGLGVTTWRDDDTVEYPGIIPMDVTLDQTTYRRTMRNWLNQQEWGMVEVHDYWYLKADGPVRKGKPTKMATWNAVLVGNILIKDKKHPEYGGRMPYVPAFNTYIPGVPDGRSWLFDVEPLIHEKEERLAAGAALINKAVKGQYWQLTGQDAPDRVPPHVRPKPDEVTAPGAGNRIESIEPFIPEFQLEQYLDRIDREMVVATGLNDLLLGLSPAAVLSSGKAINALIANFEARARMSRDLAYLWRGDTWNLAKEVWGHFAKEMKAIFEVAGRLIIANPSLTPRDDLEMSQIAANMLVSKIWSLSRVMDKTGVEDPEAEKALIREERTDASLFPADVQTQAALLATFQQMGMAQQQQQQQAMPSGPGQMGDAATAARMAQNGGRTGDEGLNGEGNGPMNPDAMGSDMALQALMGGGGGGAMQTGPGFNAMSQTMVKEGEPSNRLMLQQPIGPASEG